MLSFTASLKIYVAVEPCDMRKSFEGLAALTATALHQDVRNGAPFVFSNERRNRLKILYWDGTGIWVMAKRLEKGTFSWPESEEKVIRSFSSISFSASLLRSCFLLTPFTAK
jgi:transposase